MQIVVRLHRQIQRQPQRPAFRTHGHPNIADIMPGMPRGQQEGELEYLEAAARFPREPAAQAGAGFERSAPRGRIIFEVR